jgi:magnesium-protoporphyrin IX monomethyl ester (oxidative) cyclase
LSLDLDNPAFRRGLESLRDIAAASSAARKRGGVFGALARAGLAVRAAIAFCRLYTLPVLRHDLPVRVRAAPAW